MSITGPIEELVNYIISHVHEGLLMNKLDRQQLKANVSNGAYILQDIEFNSKSINQSLPFSAIHLHSARTARMNLVLPQITRILDEPVKIRLTELEVNLISAKKSGDSVFINQAVQLSKSDETPGLNVMTKSIGKFLASINIEVLLLSVNVLSENHSINIRVPKLTVSEKDEEKCFRLEGISVFLDRFDRILHLEQVIEGKFKLNSSEFEVFAELPKVLLALTYEQLVAVVEVVGGLEVTDKVDSNEAELIQTMNEISKMVDLGPAVRRKQGKIFCSEFNFLLTKDKIGNVDQEYFDNFHKNCFTKHFHFKLQGIEYLVNQESLQVMSLKAKFFDFVEDLDENLFKSAIDTFNDKFFDQGLEKNAGTMVEKTLIKTGKEGFVVYMKDDDWKVDINAVKMKVNEKILNEIYEVLAKIGNYGKSKEKNHNDNDNKVIIGINQISIKFIQELTETWMKNKTVFVNLILIDSVFNLGSKIEVTVDKVRGLLVRFNEEYEIFEGERIVFESICRPYQKQDLVKKKKYSAFFEPGQGYITVANTKAREKKEKLKILNDLENDFNFELENISRLNCSRLNICLVNPVLEIFSMIEFKVRDKNEINMKPVEFSRMILCVQEISIKFFTFPVNLTNLELKTISHPKTTSLTFSDFYIKTPTKEPILSSESPVSLSIIKNTLKLSLNEIIIDVLPLFSLTQLQIQSSGSKSSSSKIIKVSIKKSALVLKSAKTHGVLILESCKFHFFSNNFNSGNILISSFQLLYSNQSLSSSYFSLKSIENNENLQISASGSSIELEISKKFICDLRSCEHLTGKFYKTSSGLDTNCTITKITIGTLIFNIAKDTVEVLESLVPDFPALEKEKNEDLGQSTFFEANSNLEEIEFIHSHCNLGGAHKQDLKSFGFLEVSNVFIHLYPDYEFPEPGQVKKSFFYMITGKVSGIECFYLVSKDLEHDFELGLKDLQIINCIKGCEIKKSLIRTKENFNEDEILKLYIKFRENCGKFEDFSIKTKINPISLVIDSIFLEFCLALCKSDNPEIIQEQSNLKIGKFCIESFTLNINYLQSGSVNLLNIENFSIKFPLFEGENFENIDEALQETWKTWVEYLERNKVLTLIGRLSPVVSVSNIAGAVVNLIKTPFDSKNNEGTKHGLVTLFKVFSLEGVKVLDGVIAAAGKVSRVRSNKGALYFRFQNILKYM